MTRIAHTAALESLRGVGPSIAGDLRRLGIESRSDLIGRDPEALYETLCDLVGSRVDRCVLYVFRCAVHQAETPSPREDDTLWWNWKDRD